MSKIAGFFHPETDFSFRRKMVGSHALDSMNQAFSFSCFQARSCQKLHSFLTKNLGLIQTENEPGSDRPLPIIKKDNGCTFAIVWDGELYNASELAAELTSLGHTLEYAEDGELALYRLSGIWPFFCRKAKRCLRLCHCRYCQKSPPFISGPSWNQTAFLLCKRWGTLFLPLN